MSTIRTYIIGFALSLALSLVAFGLVYVHISSDHEELPHELLVPLLLALAVAQLFIQMICFLHLGQEKKPRWNVITFSFAAFVVLVLA